MYYTRVINIHTIPSNELVWFWLLCVSVVLMILPEIFTIYVVNITIKMMPLIATDASNDPTSFIICLTTPTSTIPIISPMITSISTVLIISLIIISRSTILTTSLTIIISTKLIINLMTMSISPYRLSAWSYPFPPYWLPTWWSYPNLPF